MKKLGWIFIIISAVVIFYNAVIVKEQNETEMNEHPWKTLFYGGQNLKRHYTFTSPYSGFEVFIMGIGVAGIAMVVLANHQQKEKQRQRNPDQY